MVSASDPHADRLVVGQLLVRLVNQFRREMLARVAERGFGDIREAHVHVLANVGQRAIRLTDLAARAQLSLAATSEVVTELEGLGYLERRPDPHDGRAKLICVTRRGRLAFSEARRLAGEIENRWASLVGDRRFQQSLSALQDLLYQLEKPLPSNTHKGQTTTEPARSGAKRRGPGDGSGLTAQVR